MNLEREETSELKLYEQVLWCRRWEFLATVTLDTKVVGLTSSTCGEGKSTPVRHLGIGAAKVGNRVLQ